MNKVIFLDIDGVMTTSVYVKHSVNVLMRVNGFTYEEAKYHTKDKFGEIFDPIAVDSLDKIIKSTNAKLVITSSWKKGKTLDFFKEMWKERNLPGEILDMTDNTIYDNRRDEIDGYLYNHTSDIESYLVIDDRNLGYKDRQILTDTNFGLNCNDITRSIHILNNLGDGY